MVSRHLNRFKPGLASIVLCAAIAMGGLVYFSMEAVRQFQTTEQAWHAYNNHATTISKSLNALQKHLGYGGYIHHFKNFILRKDESYISRLDVIAVQIYEEIDRLQSTLPTAEERNYLQVVKRTFDEYQQKRQHVQNVYRSMDSLELDKLAKVDDAPAMDALDNLQRINSETSQAQAKLARTSFEESVVTLFAGLFVILFIVGGAILLMVMLRRYKSMNTRLSNAYAQANTLYDESPNAILNVDKSGRVLRVNQQAVALFGYPAEEIQGMLVEQLIPQRFRQSHEGFRRKAQHHSRGQKMGMRDQDLYALTKDGNELRVDIGITRYTTDEGTFTLLAVSDISDTVAMKQELLDARKQAEAASQAKSNFLASMSHEIRTPLNGVLGTLQLIDTPGLPEDTNKMIAIAKESGLYLLTLINQVLDFAKIESGAVVTSKERFSLPALLNAMESMFIIRAELKGITFTAEIVGEADHVLVGDYDHIRQVLFNLVGNAIKFTDVGTVDLKIRVISISESKKQLLMEVADTGAGIAAEDQEKIFEEFSQSEVGIRHGGGTGLGLSISKRLTEAMGGTLTLTSEVGVGTTFFFTVTVDVSEDQGLVPAVNPSAFEIAPLRILVAEDNNVNQIITKSLLEQDGHEVVVVGNGMKAVDLVRDNPDRFDVILMDIQMPGMDGVQATVTIRQIVKDASRLPIFALTSNAFIDQKEEYLSIGMQTVLTKPLDQNALRREIHRYVSPAESGDRLAVQAGDADLNERHELDDRPQFDEKIIRQLVKSFSEEKLNEMFDQVSARAQEILIELRDPETSTDRASKIAHELSGTVGNLGLPRARNMAKLIEGAARNGEDFSALVTDLSAEMTIVWPALHEKITH